MKYVILIHSNPQPWGHPTGNFVAEALARPQEERDAGGAAFDAMLEELRDHVAQVIGPIAKPDEIILTPDLPKTRSGKIMRRLLRDVARGNTLGDVTTLANAEIVEQIRDQAAAAEED